MYEQTFHKPPAVDYLRKRSSEKEKVSAVAGSAGVNRPYSFISLGTSTHTCTTTRLRDSNTPRHLVHARLSDTPNGRSAAPRAGSCMYRYAHLTLWMPPPWSLESARNETKCGRDWRNSPAGVWAVAVRPVCTSAPPPAGGGGNVRHIYIHRLLHSVLSFFTIAESH